MKKISFLIGFLSYLSTIYHIFLAYLEKKQTFISSSSFSLFPAFLWELSEGRDGSKKAEKKTPLNVQNPRKTIKIVIIWLTQVLLSI